MKGKHGNLAFEIHGAPTVLAVGRGLNMSITFNGRKERDYQLLCSYKIVNLTVTLNASILLYSTKFIF
jgi:hypothetical protein